MAASSKEIQNTVNGKRNIASGPHFYNLTSINGT